MSLYIRLHNSFWSNRKTAKLRLSIGDDALWIVPRLWSYAAENQPDGDLSKFTSEELAMLIGCPKHSATILDLLKEAGFIQKDGKIHHWDEHNAFHSTYSNRAKIAATARWSKKDPSPSTPTRKKDTERERESSNRQALHEASHKHPTSMLEASLNPVSASLSTEPEIPTSLNTPEFVLAWAEWIAYRKQAKKKLTPATMEKQLAMLSRHSPTDAAAIIDRSISHGWQGLFEPDPLKDSPSTPSAQRIAEGNKNGF